MISVKGLGGRYPAIVSEYLADRRMCRVEIPGLTDGAEDFPLAEIEYPIGDKSKSGDFSTEIEILKGDLVWVSFICDDPRYPIITGWRNPTQDNSLDWRRWHHKNIEIVADEKIILKVGESIIEITPAGVLIDGQRIDIGK